MGHQSLRDVSTAVGPLRDHGLPLPHATREDNAIVLEILAGLRAELGGALVGMLATGSRARGVGDPGSDIDLDVITRSPYRQKRFRCVRGTDVEILLTTRDDVLRAFDRERASTRGVAQHLWMTGFVVADTGGVVAALQAEAVRQWAAGPAPVPQAEAWRYVETPRRVLAQIAQAVERDPEQATLAAGVLLTRVVEAHARVRRGWCALKPKRALAELDTWDPVAGALAREATRGDAAARVAALGRLVEHVARAVDPPYSAPAVPGADTIDGRRA